MAVIQRVYTYSELAVGLHYGNDAIHPVCGLMYPFYDFHSLQLFLYFCSDFHWDLAWGVDDWFAHRDVVDGVGDAAQPREDVSVLG